MLSCYHILYNVQREEPFVSLGPVRYCTWPLLAGALALGQLLHQALGGRVLHVPHELCVDLQRGARATAALHKRTT